MVTDAILDTSILIDLLRAFPPATEWFASLGRREEALLRHASSIGRTSGK